MADIGKATYRCDGVIRETGKEVAIAVAAGSPEEAIRIANEHGVLVESAHPDNKVIFCPFCFTILPSDIPMVGQTVVCPRCCAQVKMPDATGRTTNAASGQFILAVIGVIVALLLLARGCAFWELSKQL